MDTTSSNPTVSVASVPAVIIYSTPVCTYCKMAKEYFKENNVAYTEFDVAADAEKRAEMIDKSGQMGVPVIEIADNIIVGFDKQTIAQLLSIPASPTATA